MQIICKNPKNYNLTLNKSYNVIDSDEESYVIKNDKDKLVVYRKNLFEPAPNAQPARAARPVPPPPVRLTDEQIAASFDPNNNRILGRIQGRHYTLELAHTLDATLLDTACSVIEINNVQAVYNEINQKINEVIQNDRDNTEIVNKVFRKKLNAEIDEEDLVIIGVNQNADDDLVDLLRSMADDTYEYVSTKTGNDVKIFTIFTNNI